MPITGTVTSPGVSGCLPEAGPFEYTAEDIGSRLGIIPVTGAAGRRAGDLFSLSGNMIGQGKMPLPGVYFRSGSDGIAVPVVVLPSWR